ncbi:MAG: hypothetical protein Q9197_004705 [Variospora fuerteventurae]
MAIGHNFSNLRTGKNHPILESLLRIGHWGTFRNVMRRFPLLYPFSYILLPPKIALSYIAAHKASKKLIRTRVENRHDHKQPDYISQWLKDESAIPEDGFLVSQAGHLILDHFESSSVLSAGFYFLTTNTKAMGKLQAELRHTFSSYGEIREGVLQELPWLHAVIEEVIRLHTNVPYGLPRISPGFTVDGHHVPKGCIVSTCAYATTHSPHYFHLPNSFAPQCWLPPTHEDYDRAFDTDIRSAFRPFSVRSRNCLGQNMAYQVLRAMFAKLCWRFDWELVNGEQVDWDRDLRLYFIWQKPAVRVRLTGYEGKA